MKNTSKLEKKVYPVPPEIDKEIARLKLAGMGDGDRHVDGGTKKYLGQSWEMGTWIAGPVAGQPSRLA